MLDYQRTQVRLSGVWLKEAESVRILCSLMCYLEFSALQIADNSPIALLSIPARYKVDMNRCIEHMKADTNPAP